MASNSNSGVEAADLAQEAEVDSTELNNLEKELLGIEEQPELEVKAEEEEVEEVETPEAEKETEEEAEVEETEEEPEAETPEAEDETKGWSERAQKRFNELTARAKTAEERQQELESTIEELNTKLESASHEGAAPVSSANPLANYTDERKLSQREQEARQLRAQLIRNPDGWEYNDDRNNLVEITPQQVREALVKVTDELETHIPQQRNYLAEERQFSRQALEVYPDLKDSTSELRQKADAMTTQFPEVKKFPAWKFAAGYYASGQILAEVAGAKTGAVLKAIREGTSIDAILLTSKAPAPVLEKNRKPAPRVAPGDTRPRRVPAGNREQTAQRLAAAAASGNSQAEADAMLAYLE